MIGLISVLLVVVWKKKRSRNIESNIEKDSTVELVEPHNSIRNSISPPEMLRHSSILSRQHEEQQTVPRSSKKSKSASIELQYMTEITNVKIGHKLGSGNFGNALSL
jgi:hypothetical protein